MKWISSRQFIMWASMFGLHACLHPIQSLGMLLWEICSQTWITPSLRGCTATWWWRAGRKWLIFSQTLSKPWSLSKPHRNTQYHTTFFWPWSDLCFLCRVWNMQSTVKWCCFIMNSAIKWKVSFWKLVIRIKHCSVPFQPINMIQQIFLRYHYPPDPTCSGEDTSFHALKADDPQWCVRCRVHIFTCRDSSQNSVQRIIFK